MSIPRPAAAACRGSDPELFFPERETPADEIERALRICRRCPAVRECLKYAISHDVSGIWGGTTKEQRDAARIEFGIIAIPTHLPG